MPRSTRKSHAPGAVALLLALSLSGCSPAPHDLVYSGQFSFDDPIRLSNQTITSGTYLVGYSLDVLVTTKEPVNFICTVLDPSGTIEFFSGLARGVDSGRWVHLDVDATFELPDLTLGLRCAPEPAAALTVVFRNVELSAQELR